MPTTLNPDQIEERRRRAREVVEAGDRANSEAEALQVRLSRLRRASDERTKYAHRILRKARLLT